MPIPLGILAAAGIRPAGAAGAYELIETINVGSGGAASVTFSNLNTYSTTYQHLQIRLVGRYVSASSGVGNSININFNSDTASNYSYHQLYGQSGTVSSDGGTSTTGMIAQRLTSGDMTSGSFGAIVIDILDPYETTKFKTIRSLGGFASSFSLIGLNSGNWRSTNAVSSITLGAGSNTFAQYSRFSIYGLKAS